MSPRPTLILLAKIGPALFVANEIRGAIAVAALLAGGGAHEIALYAAFVQHFTEGLIR